MRLKNQKLEENQYIQSGEKVGAKCNDERINNISIFFSFNHTPLKYHI